MKRVHFSLDLFVLCFALISLAPSAIAESQQLDLYCQGKHEGKVSDASVSRRYEQAVGFNPAQYITEWYTSGPWLLAGDGRQALW